MPNPGNFRSTRLVAFLAGEAFLSVAYYPYLCYLTAFAAALDNEIWREMMATGPPSGQAPRAEMDVLATLFLPSGDRSRGPDPDVSFRNGPLDPNQTAGGVVFDTGSGQHRGSGGPAPLGRSSTQGANR